MPDEKSRAIFTTTSAESEQNKNKYFLDSADKISYFYEEKAVGPKGELLVEPHLSLNKIGHALHELNDTFRRVTFDEKVKEVAFQLGFEEPAIVQSMYIFKNPKIGGEGECDHGNALIPCESFRVFLEYILCGMWERALWFCQWKF